jgi:hypothetical protein
MTQDDVAYCSSRNLVVENPAKNHDGRAESQRQRTLEISYHLAVSVDVVSLVRLNILLACVHAIT